MTSPSTESLTPRLPCPNCTNPFRIPRDKVGALLRCKSCRSYFRVKQDTAGDFVTRLEPIPPAAVPPAPPTRAPRRPSVSDPTMSHPGTLPMPGAEDAAAPPDDQPDESLPSDIDATVLGKLIDLPNGNATPPPATEQPVVGAPIALSDRFRPVGRRIPAGGSTWKRRLLVLLAVVVVLSALGILGCFFIHW